MKGKCHLLEFNFIFAILYIFAIACDAITPCSEIEDLNPCSCTELAVAKILKHSNGTISSYEEKETWVTCDGIDSLGNLTIAMKRLKGFEINTAVISSSRIGYLPSHLFFDVIVKEIQIRYTKLKSFTQAEESAFLSLENTLLYLSMRYCGLIDGLKWEKLGELRSLNTLDLTGNHLDTIPPHWFNIPPPDLQFLHLKQNKISKLHDSSFAKMYRLKILDLSENQISTLKRTMFPDPANNLENLYLSYNEIETLPGDFFEGMSSLKRLYLDYNKITTLHETPWKQIWGELTHLDLTGNQIMCDCSIKWMTELLLPCFLFGACAEPPGLRERKLISLWPWDLECPKYRSSPASQNEPKSGFSTRNAPFSKYRAKCKTILKMNHET
ncbi:leucine-rich repeats and immunoglobulin-like domains protein 2 [Limulus polyphemus]|uniref:Leucine-rich repeats and immunoglobulin-like domains protein 2 n=1 Tax=Limulus polyphemus TaxID=6850 RepID=A0ABM1S0Z4_LIMPO|nr:leucine-rich repeats and immunoglobulin-like domains protein 2 [Limulus polyphemus]